MKTGYFGIYLGCCLLMHVFAVLLGMVSILEAVKALIWQSFTLLAVLILESIKER